MATYTGQQVYMYLCKRVARPKIRSGHGLGSLAVPLGMNYDKFSKPQTSCKIQYELEAMADIVFRKKTKKLVVTNYITSYYCKYNMPAFVQQLVLCQLMHNNTACMFAYLVRGTTY